MNFAEYIEYNKYTAEDLNKLTDIDFSNKMAEVLQLALIRNASFYEWTILNFDSVMEKDELSLAQIESKTNSIMSFFAQKDPNMENECRILRFGYIFKEALESYFKDKFSEGEYFSLGMIASAYISYKRELLSMEEFYEIRDMFVPFNLLISLDPYDVYKVLDIIKSSNKYEQDIANFVLLKKIGKAIIVNNVTEEEIVNALNQLIVEWD